MTAQSDLFVVESIHDGTDVCVRRATRQEVRHRKIPAARARSAS